MAKVTVVIPCYNHGEFLLETLDSVQAQSFGDYEIIVVDDGSTDPATCVLLSGLHRPKVRVIHTENRGVSAARNRAIVEAAGEYILPLDADDMIAPTYLEKAVAVLDAQPEVAVVFGERVMFGEREGAFPLPDYNSRRLLAENLIYPAAMYRKNDWHKVGGYCDAMVHGWEDWEFWISMSCLNKRVVKLPETLFLYRVRNSSRDHSLRFFNKLSMFLLMVRRHKELYLRNAGYVVRRLFLHQCSKLSGHR
jgi:glycosyltransferase involved in cell wall biosynthesis